MAKKDINRSVRITLDHSDMTSKYKELSAKSEELQKSLSKLNEEGKGNTRETQALQRQYDATTKEMDKHNAKVEQTRSVLNNLSGSSYKELLAVKKQLQKEIQSETRGTEEFAAKSEQLTRVQEELKVVQGEMAGVTSSLVNELSNAPGVVGTLTTSFRGLITACKAFIANPVGAVIAAIGAAVAICVKGFRDFASASEEGGMKAAKSLAPIKVIGTEIGKLFKVIGSHVVDIVSSMTQMIYNAMGWLAKYSDTAKEIHENMTRQYEIEEKSYELGRKRQEMMQKEAQYTRDLSELKLKIRQTDKYSAEERKAFMEEYLAKENELSQLKVDMARQERELWEMESAQDDNNYEANMKGAELNAAIFQAEAEHHEKVGSMERRRISLMNELNGTKAEAVKLTQDTRDAEVAAIDQQMQKEKLLYANQYNDGELTRSIYLKKLEELELDALYRKFEIYELDKEKRIAIESEIQAFKVKLLESGINQKISPEISQAQSIVDQKKEIARKGNIELNKIARQGLKKEQEVFAKQQEVTAAYRDLATGAADSFGNILGGFIGDSEQSAEDFQYNLLILSLNTLQQMVMLWTAELFGKMTTQFGPIAGPAMAAAGTALIQGVFTGVKNSIKRPSSKEIDGSSASSERSRSASVSIVDSGYASGGYTGSGGVLEPAGIVHKGEYVIPAWQMQIPATMDMVRILEATRLAGIGHNNIAGYAEGGAVSGSSTVLSENVLDKIHGLLQDIARNPIPAYVILSELEKQQVRRDRAKRYGEK